MFLVNSLSSSFGKRSWCDFFLQRPFQRDNLFPGSFSTSQTPLIQFPPLDTIKPPYWIQHEAADKRFLHCLFRVSCVHKHCERRADRGGEREKEQGHAEKNAVSKSLLDVQTDSELNWRVTEFLQSRTEQRKKEKEKRCGGGGNTEGMLINKILFLDECRDFSLPQLLSLPYIWDGSNKARSCGWEAREGELKEKIFWLSQNCRQPQDNKLDILKFEAFFFLAPHKFSPHSKWN